MINVSDIIDLSICTDCMMLIANGDASGMSPEREQEIAVAMETNWDGYHLVPGDVSTDYDTYPCDICNSYMAGERMSAHAWPADL